MRRVAREKVAPRADEIDRTAEYPHDMFELLRGARPVHAALSRRIRRHAAARSPRASPSRSSGASATTPPTCWSCSGRRSARSSPAATDAQKQRLLPGLASGELRAAFSVTEPQSGSDVAGITHARAAGSTAAIASTARRSGAPTPPSPISSWSRRRPVTTTAAAASTSSSSSAARTGFDDRAARKTRWARAACRRARSSSTTCSCPTENRLGAEGGKGFKVVMEAFNSRAPDHRRARRRARAGRDRPRDRVRPEPARLRPGGRATSRACAGCSPTWRCRPKPRASLVYRAAAMVDAGATGPRACAVWRRWPSASPPTSR